MQRARGLALIPALAAEVDHERLVAQASDRALPRLNHPTINDDAPIPRQVPRAIIGELHDALADLTPEELAALGVDLVPAMRDDLCD